MPRTKKVVKHSWRLTQLEKRQMLTAYKRGDPLQAIADRFGVSYNYPSIYASRQGVNLRRQKRRTKKSKG